MSEFSEKINAHLEAGTCYICGKPVGDADAIHGLTGAHWNCHEAEEKKTEEAFAKAEAGLKKAHVLLGRLT